MKNIIFKDAEDSVPAITQANGWIDFHPDCVIINRSEFFDRIDEKWTVVISYYQ